MCDDTKGKFAAQTDQCLTNAVPVPVRNSVRLCLATLVRHYHVCHESTARARQDQPHGSGAAAKLLEDKPSRFEKKKKKKGMKKINIGKETGQCFSF